MSTFFEINKQGRIGYKKLTDADLGTGIGNQTHIGLFADTLEFVNEGHKTSFSKLIFNSTSKEVLCFLDFIHRENGRIDAPKIRKGDERELEIDGIRYNSVVREIREVIQNTNPNEHWYIIWFGLTNEELVFFLFRENSIEFNELQQIIPNFGNRGRIESADNNFVNVVNYLESKTDGSNILFLQDLEIIAQTDEVAAKIVKPRFFDIEKAKLKYAITGRKGEELIAEYLERLQADNQIQSFNWMNASRESAMPYDFEIEYNNNNLVYTDVKTTSYNFDQGMIFSKGELAFISQNANYHVYRVYDLMEDQQSLRICENIYQLSLNLVSRILTFEQDILVSQSKLNSLKLSISPANQLLNFNDRIILQ
jgi:hypothetical protein